MVSFMVSYDEELKAFFNACTLTEHTLFLTFLLTGFREQEVMNDKCKAIARRAKLDTEKFDLKTFRSTYATRMLRAGFPARPNLPFPLLREELERKAQCSYLWKCSDVVAPHPSRL